MIRWFDVNWSAIGPWIPLINLRDEQTNCITLRRERAEAMRRRPQ
jgi:hypothetical protein